MRKIFFAGIGVIVLIVGFFLIKNSFGNVLPAILPVKDISNNSPFQNGQVLTSFNLPSGFEISHFSKDLRSARDLEFSPGGVLVVSLPAEGKIVALPDFDRDGVADEKKIVIEGLRKPHGISFNNGKLFIAEENKVSRYSWDEKSLSSKFERKLLDLPAGGGHSTRSIVFTSENELLVSIGSSCNVCVEDDSKRASIWILDSDGTNPRLFAKGLRNSVFMALNPMTKEIWATEMGRDLIGDDIPPEEINIIRDGKDYGWPYCYSDAVHDNSFDPKNLQSCKETVPPIFKYQAHSAPLGLVFINSPNFPDDWQGDLLVSYHGSWNRTTPTGYKVVHMKVSGNTITGEEDFITGFLQGNSTIGRPVDLTFDSSGNLYLSDDKAGGIYIIRKN